MDESASKLDSLILMKVRDGHLTFGQILTGPVYMEALRQSIEQRKPIQRVLEARLNALSSSRKIERVELAGMVGWTGQS